MRYWPLSTLRNSPLMPQAYVLELDLFYRQLPSRAAYYTCIEVAKHTAAVDAPNLVVVENIGTPSRRLYLDYPSEEEWFRLERTIMCELDDGYMFILMDAIH